MGRKLRKKVKPQNQMHEDTVKKCFVPNCTNKEVNGCEEGGSLEFFQVPEGIEGLFWEKAVKIRQRKYDKMIGLLSSTDYMLGLDDVNNATRNYEYCCEVHFDIDADIERIINDNGTMEFKVKPGAVPQIKPKQKKRLCEYYQIQRSPDEDSEMNNEIIKEEVSVTDGMILLCSNEAKTNGFVSLVDISTLTNQNSNAVMQVYHEVITPIEQQPEISYEPVLPMLPLTSAMMQRKSTYYMGLQQNDFFHLLQLAKQKGISDVKVMITIRKLRLNEEFEALGDLFDLDKITTEQYFEESKHEVINLVDILCTTAPTTNQVDKCKYEKHSTTAATAPHPILFQPINVSNTPNAICIDRRDDDELSTNSSVQSSESSYDPSEPDPDFMSEDFDSYSDASLCTEKTEECALCSEWFTPRGMALHSRSAHFSLRLNLNKTTCGLCLQNFETNHELRNHQKEAHDGNAYGCDLCKKQYLKNDQIVKHILTKHAQARRYLCDLCGKGFPYQSSLTRHISRTHWRIRDYECNLCDMKYLHANSLADHIRATHTSYRPFKCAFEGCGKTFNRLNVFKGHSRVHAIDKYECHICSKQFSFKANLTTHKRNIHGMMI